jgi:hypothetical protein
MKAHPKLPFVFVATVLAGLALAVPAAARQADAGMSQSELLATAIEACRVRSVEGSQYRLEDTRVIQIAELGVNRYAIDIKSPAGDIHCVVTREGEIFSADLIE